MQLSLAPPTMRGMNENRKAARPALGEPQIDLEVAQELLRDGELRLVLDDDGGWLPWAPQGEWPGRELWLKADLRAGDRASSLAIAATDGHPVAPPERREMQGICRRWNEAGGGLRAHLDTRAGSALVFAWIESDVVAKTSSMPPSAACCTSSTGSRSSARAPGKHPRHGGHASGREAQNQSGKRELRCNNSKAG